MDPTPPAAAERHRRGLLLIPALVLAAVFAAGVASKHYLVPTVELRNDSGRTLTGVKVEASGDGERRYDWTFETLAPGESIVVRGTDRDSELIVWRVTAAGRVRPLDAPGIGTSTSTVRVLLVVGPDGKVRRSS